MIQSIRLLTFLGMLLLAAPVLQAQTAADLLDWTRTYLDRGNCDDAKETYALYKEKVPQGNAEVERRMAECKPNQVNASGNGEIVYNGYRYVGEYKNNTPDGKGKLYYNNGEIIFYEGEWSDGLRHGRGKLVWKEGQRYEGHWEYDNISGSGTMFFENGDKYVGEFINGSMTKGTYYYNSGDHLGGRYEGEFRNGKRCGKGIMYYKDGSKVDAIWSDDEINGKCVAYYSNGKKEFEGTFKNGECDGYCTIYRKDGGYEKGSYEYGERHGYWVEAYYNDNGFVEWKGNYFYGKRDGIWYVYLNGKNPLKLKYVMGELK